MQTSTADHSVHQVLHHPCSQNWRDILPNMSTWPPSSVQDWRKGVWGPQGASQTTLRLCPHYDVPGMKFRAAIFITGTSPWKVGDVTGTSLWKAGDVPGMSPGRPRDVTPPLPRRRTSTSGPKHA